MPKPHRPFVVVRAVNAPDRINYYEQQLLRRVVDVDYLRAQIAKARSEGSDEQIIEQHATLAEAQKVADKLALRDLLAMVDQFDTPRDPGRVQAFVGNVREVALRGLGAQ